MSSQESFQHDLRLRENCGDAFECTNEKSFETNLVHFPQRQSRIAKMLAVAQASLSFSAPLPTFHAVSRTSAPLMQEKSKAIPFLKKPPALDGEAAPGHCPNQRTRLSSCTR